MPGKPRLHHRGYKETTDWHSQNTDRERSPHKILKAEEIDVPIAGFARFGDVAEAGVRVARGKLLQIIFQIVEHEIT